MRSTGSEGGAAEIPEKEPGIRLPVQFAETGKMTVSGKDM